MHICHVDCGTGVVRSKPDTSFDMHVHAQHITLCMQSQARSVTKDMTDADTEAQFDAETGRLHNQFNFNDRAVQVCFSPMPAESGDASDSALGMSLSMVSARICYTLRYPLQHVLLSQMVDFCLWGNTRGRPIYTAVLLSQPLL